MFDCTQKLILVSQGLNEEIYCPSLTYRVAQEASYNRANWKGRSWCALLLWSEIVDTVVRLGRSLITPISIALYTGVMNVGASRLCWHTFGVVGAIIITPFVFAIQLIIQVGHILRVCLASVSGFINPQMNALPYLLLQNSEHLDYPALVMEHLNSRSGLHNNFPVPKTLDLSIEDPTLVNIINLMIELEMEHIGHYAFFTPFALDAPLAITNLVKKWEKYLQPYFKKPNLLPSIQDLFITSIVNNYLNDRYVSYTTANSQSTPLQLFIKTFVANIQTPEIIAYIKNTDFKQAYFLIEALAKTKVPHLKMFIPAFKLKESYDDQKLMDLVITAITSTIYNSKQISSYREAFKKSKEFSERFIFEPIANSNDSKQELSSTIPSTPLGIITIEDIRNIRQTFENLGVGGLPDEFEAALMPILAARGPLKKTAQKRKLKLAKGIILHGPPGTGKTTIARHLATVMKVPQERFQLLDATSLLNQYVGNTEEAIRALFEPVQKDFRDHGQDAPLHIIVIDEIDSILSNRDGASKRHEVTPVNQFLTLLDGVIQNDNFLVIGMTNKLNVIDSGITRPGRMDTIIKIDVPNKEQRRAIFEIHCKALIENDCLAKDVDFDELAQKTDNCTGADIEKIIRAANDLVFVFSIRNRDDLVIDKIGMSHFLKAISSLKIKGPREDLK